MPISSTEDLARYYAHIGAETVVRGSEIVTADVVIVTTAAGAEPAEYGRFRGDGLFERPGGVELTWPSQSGTIALTSDITGGDGVSFTNSAELRALLSDPTGTGAAFFAGGNFAAATGLSLNLTGSGTGTLKLAEWSSSNAYFAAGFAGAVGAGTYNLMSSPGDQDLYINVPTGQDIHFRVNNSSIWELSSTYLAPAAAGGSSLGRSGVGVGSIFVDSASTSNTLELTRPTIASNIQVAWPASAGTLALTSDIPAGHSAVTMSGTPDYITLVGQDIVRGLVDLAADVTGTLDSANIDQTLSVTSLTASGLTAGRVPIVSTAGLLADDAGLLYDATTDQLTSGIFKQGANNAGGLYGTPSAGTNDYRLFVNNSNEWELRHNVGGIVNATYKFGGAAVYPGGAEDLGTTSAPWGDLILAGGTSGYSVLTAPAIAGSATITLPAATGTLATLDGTETLSNKYIRGNGTSLILQAGASGTVFLDISESTDTFTFYDTSANTIMQGLGSTASLGLSLNLGTGTDLWLSGAFIDIGEYSTTTDAPAPSDNRGRLYVRDNGAGKEQLVVRFATGAVQVLATEP